MTDTIEQKERNWAMFCHLAALCIWIGIPFGNIIGPLVVWLIKKDDMPFVDDQGKESMNFQISMTIYAVISGILIFFGIGLVLIVAVVLADVVLVIVATVKTSEGTAYRYPFTLRLIT